MDNSKPKTARRSLGDYGEELARNWYVCHGYEIVDRNVNISHVGEIDLIVSRVFDGCSEYVFSEVKTRSSARAGEGYESVNYLKRMKMRTCAMSWIDANGLFKLGKIKWRLDVVSIDLSLRTPKVRVFENVDV